VITPDVTHILIDQIHFSNRRIYTDGRNWPDEIEPAFDGYSIGKWIDEDADGHFHTLVVETRALKGPRVYDASGIPLHLDNQSIIKERFYLDKTDSNRLYDEITVIDHALTRPWTVTKSFRRNDNPRPWWPEYVCADGQSHVQIGSEAYFLSADGLLMPAKKDQRPPDLRFFQQPRQQ
jgi:hypothetical protein